MQTPERVGYDQDQSRRQHSNNRNTYIEITPSQAAPTSTVDTDQTKSTANVYKDYKSRQSISIGILQIITGSLSIVFNATQLNVYPGFLGQGVWGGVLILISGSLGVAAGKYKSKCQVIPFTVLCSVSILAAFIIMLCGIIDAAVSAGSLGDGNTENTVFAMGVLLATLGAVGVVLCIWGSALGCRVACCSCCYSCCCSCCWCCPRVPSESFAHTNGTAGQQQFIVPAGYEVRFIPIAELRTVSNAQMPMVLNPQMQTAPNAHTPTVPNSHTSLNPNPPKVPTAPEMVPNSHAEFVNSAFTVNIDNIDPDDSSFAHMTGTQQVAAPSPAGQQITDPAGYTVQFIPTAEMQTDPNAQTPMVPNSEEHLTPKPSTVCTAPDVIPNSDEYLAPKPSSNSPEFLAPKPRKFRTAPSSNSPEFLAPKPRKFRTAPDTYSPNTYQPLVYNLPEYVSFDDVLVTFP